MRKRYTEDTSHSDDENEYNSFGIGLGNINIKKPRNGALFYLHNNFKRKT